MRLCAKMTLLIDGTTVVFFFFVLVDGVDFALSLPVNVTKYVFGENQRHFLTGKILDFHKKKIKLFERSSHLFDQLKY